MKLEQESEGPPTAYVRVSAALTNDAVTAGLDVVGVVSGSENGHRERAGVIKRAISSRV